MELRSLRSFVAVAEDLHFGRAAQRLHLAQSAVSQHIAHLERELGVTLLARTSRRVDLTPAGTAFLAELKRSLASLENAALAARRAAAGEEGWLRLGFVDSAAYDLLPRLLRAFHEARPDVRIQTYEMSTEASIEALPERLDAAILRDAEPREGMQMTVVADEPLLGVVDDAHPLATRDRIDLVELAEERFISFPRDHVPMVYDHLIDVCRRSGFRPREGASALQYATMLGLVAAGYGVTVVPASARVVGSQHLHYLALSDPHAVSRLSLAVPEDAPGPFVDVLRGLVEQLAPSLTDLVGGS